MNTTNKSEKEAGNATDNRVSELSNRFRNRRFQLFEELAAALPRPISIIDIGGTVDFWVQRNWGDRDGVQITTLNQFEEASPCSNISSVVGDATRISYSDQSFDICFSNSVIEHLFNFVNQTAMAAEVQRVARAYWIQTPNYWFPLEPHFRIPGYHWAPDWLKHAYIKYVKGRTDPEMVDHWVREIQLLTPKQMRELFPDSQLYREKIMGLTKSITAYRGFHP